jgi:hypothetical protein
MAKPAIKIPLINGGDKPGLGTDPGTFIFNTDTGFAEYIDGSGNYLPIVSSTANVITQQIWVSEKNGIDAGNTQGGINSPFQSYNAALAFAKTTVSYTNPIVIRVVGDITITGDFLISPNISVIFDPGSFVTVTLKIVADPDYISVPWSNTKTYIIGGKLSASQININNGGTNNEIYLLQNNLVNIPSVFVADNTGNNLVIFKNSTNVDPAFSGSFTMINGNVLIDNCSISCLPLLTVTNGSNCFLVINNSQGFGQITLSTVSGTANCILTNCSKTGVNLTSTNCFLTTDAESINVQALNFTGGATLSQLTYTTDSSGLQINSALFSPVNYTPTSPSSKVNLESILSHLNGINVALGSGLSNPHGTFTSGVVMISGGTLPTDIAGFWSSTGSNSGDIVTVAVEFRFTATNSFVQFNITNPIGGTFLSNTKAALGGQGCIYVPVSPSLGDGAVFECSASLSGPNVGFAAIVAVGSGTKSVSLSYMYEIA